MTLDTSRWTHRLARQQPDWPDQQALDAAACSLSLLPALVRPEDCDRLRSRIATAAAGRAFLLQGGDCAETFADARLDRARDKARMLNDAAQVLEASFGVPVVRVGRLAGQFAKPRSQPTEHIDGVELPVYRGDMVNGVGAVAAERTPDPRRLLTAYRCAAEVLRVRDEPATGELFTSHEALIMEYETALTRIDDRTGQPYALSAHTLWLGERTRQPNGSHVRFAADIRNPIGVKLGPTTTPDDLLTLIDILDPEREPGRLSCIARFGSYQVRDLLPELVGTARGAGAEILWVCDPMHGNTFTSSVGYKTRHFQHVLDEALGFFEVHRELGTHPGGLHLEATDRDVTECLGGAQVLTEADLGLRYETACDPRLNRSQLLELAHAVAEVAGLLRTPALV
jgi:3-deoxy-7-phosphoheptulonate synthase